VLDRNRPLLFRHFERRYTYFQPVTPPTEECLLVPLYVAGTAVGTIWAITHHARRQFDAEDQRQLVSLGRFASAAYQAQAELVERRRAEAALASESCQRARRSTSKLKTTRSWY
jgi:GAF domain-containing protein